MTEPATTPPENPPGLLPAAFSNSIRLSIPQWLGIGFFTVLVAFFGPSLWKQAERFTLEPDYRIPQKLGNDYWLYERFAGSAAEQYDVLVLGDSVVWGEFVNRHETLSHYLNQRAGRERFANLGLNGTHPLALDSLIESYGGDILDKNVLLQCNPTWLRDVKTDLQHEDASVNHPRLVPQFVPRIAAYKEEVSPRLGVLVERRVPLIRWSNHLQQAYYRIKIPDEVPSDIPTWTLKHPYDNPFEPLTRELPPSDDNAPDDARAWFKRGVAVENHTWIDMDTSLQWHAFQHLVEVLQRRGNRVFVLVGPFNEHQMTPASLQRYHKLKGTVTAWLQAKQVPHLAPAALPSESYADASHPLAEGYALLARRVLEPDFRTAFFQENRCMRAFLL